MTGVRSPNLTFPVVKAPTAVRARLHIPDILLPIALGLWAFGVSTTDATHLGAYGLPPALPPVLYAGIAVLIVSAAIELARARPSGWRMAIHSAALTVMLYAVAPLVYAQARYEWLYKTVGVVQYVNFHGQLNRHIDIYQNWPGFFALAAWLDKVSGVGSPLAYAKWAQLIFELAALPLLYLIYDALKLSDRQRWIALLLYSAGNWVGQDYLSPQALGTVLYLGIMALAVRWFYVNNPNGWWPGRKGHGKGIPRLISDPGVVGDQRLRQSALFLSALLLIYFVLSFTHQLTPYMMAVQLGALAALRMLRPRWLPAALLAIAVGYLIPRYSFVTGHFSIFSIGRFFLNATPPAFSAGHVSPAQQFIERSAEALSAWIWVLAALAVWLRWRSTQSVLALALLAFSPIIMLAVSNYGHEGVLRVYLFSLPWSAALASLVLAPSVDITRTLPTRLSRAAGVWDSVRRAARRATGLARVSADRLVGGALRTPLALAVAVALFVPAFYGDDSFNQMTGQEVTAVTSFWETAPAGLVYVPIDDAPVADTSRYNQFPLSKIFGSTGLLGAKPVTSQVAQQLAVAAKSHTSAGEHAYVLVTPNMVAYNRAYGVAPPDSFAILLNSLAHSSSWVMILDRDGVVVYELRPPLPAPSLNLPGS